MSDIINKSDYMALSKKKASEYGLSEANFDIMKTSGYFASMLAEMFEMGSYIGASLQNERYASTAKLKDSLIKLAKDANVELDFATPARMVVSISLDLSEINDNLSDTDIDTVKSFTLNSNEYYIRLDGKPFSFDYDIIIKRKENTGILKNVDPYTYSVEFSDEGTTNPLDNENLKGIPLNSFIVPSDVEIGKNLLTFMLPVRQYKRVNTELRYLKGDGSTEIKTVSFDNEIAEFKCFYKATDYDTDEIELNKSLFFNENLDVDTQTVFYKYKSSNSINIYNKKAANFIPAINSILRVEQYLTLGESGNFTYYGSDITLITTSDVPLTATITILDNPSGGKNMPTIEELRKKVILANSSRGGIINEKDLKALYDMYSGIYKIRKSRHDMFDNEYSVTVALKDDLNDMYIQTATLDLYVDLQNMVAKAIDEGDLRYYPITYNSITSFEYGLAYIDKSVADNVLSYAYALPFYMCYDAKTGFVSIYEKFINRKYYTKTSFMKDEAEMQFIVNALRTRKAPQYTYNITFSLITSLPIETDVVFHTKDETTYDIIDTGELKTRILIKKAGLTLGYLDPVMIDYDETNKYYLYGVGDFVDGEPYGDTVDLYLNEVNGELIKINVPTTDLEVYVYVFKKNTSKTSADEVFKDIVGYDLNNIYKVDSLDLFKEYSHIAKTNISHLTPTTKIFKSIPMISEYMLGNLGQTITDLIEEEVDKLDAIYALTEENFSQRLVFANTYGFAKRYKVNTDASVDLNSLSLTLSMGIKARTGYEDNVDLDSVILFVKSYIKSIDFNNGDSLRISELIAILHSSFGWISYIEFNGINTLPSNYQYIGLDPAVLKSTSEITIPEIINVSHVYSPILDAWVPDLDIYEITD